MNSSSALVKEHDKFVKRQAEATAFLPSTAKRQKIDKRSSSSSSQKTNRSKPAISRSKTSSDFSSDYPSSSSTSKSRDLALTRIVEELHKRFLSGQTDPVTLDEIIKEFGFVIDSFNKDWLASEALLSNPKIEVKKEDDVNKFVYKPALSLKAPRRVPLLNVLKSRHELCQGAVTVDDVRDTIPEAKADIIIDSLTKTGDVIKKTSNKKEILFYTDRRYDLHVNSEFVDLWRTISVDGLDDKKICEFIANRGHHSLTKNTPRPAQLPTKSKRGGHRPVTIKNNQHVALQLVDYSNTTITK